MYKSTPAFLTKEYDIDVVNNKINVDGYKDNLEFLYEFIGDWVTIKALPFTLITWGIVLPILLLIGYPIKRLGYAFLLLCGFYIVLFFIFNVMFVTMPNRFLRKLQMSFEVPIHIAMYPHLRKIKTESVAFDKANSVVFHFKWYWKYDMTISAEAGKYLERITYKKITREQGRLLTVTFNKPVTGSVILKYRGTLLDTNIQHKTS